MNVTGAEITPTTVKAGSRTREKKKTDCTHKGN